ncbi:tyrosinase family oxidase copper chaperone [Streptomyces niveus]|uniref:tyrosinase family oxidase copper chaperone n=1 Tax=Streptomyces niveus TaxID=193462 RepID=UPI0035E18E18
MAGGTKLEPRPVAARPAESPAPAPPPPSQPPQPSAPLTPLPPTRSSRPPRSSRTRRFFLRAAFAFGAIGGTAAALTPIFRADPRKSAAPAPGPVDGVPDERFDEMYGGRRIQGTASGVRIDGRPLHLMRRADGTYVSVVNHFESFPTALATARAAVDDLGGTQLSLAGPALH